MSTTYEAITIEKGQSIIDATLQACGSLEGLFSFAQQNNKSITAELIAGELMQGIKPTDKVTALAIKGLGIVPATLNTPLFIASGDDAVVIEVSSVPSNLSATVEVGQNIFDIAIQLHGTLEGLFDIANRNNKAITDEVSPGTLMVASVAMEMGIRSGILALGIVPATSMNSAQTIEVLPEGIGYWAIETDFKIS